jgi:tRNA (adenine57-N1/adenine58-N1)-methyltransferase
VTKEGFAPGDWVLLRDHKGRELLVQAGAEGTCHTHRGEVSLQALVGLGSGSLVETASGGRLEAHAPSQRELILHMPRGAQIIYPKDLAAILGELSLLPGMRVLEAGIGSGALTIALLRAGAIVTSYEVREDFARRAAKNIAAFVPAELVGHHELVVADVGEVAAESKFDRLALDMLAPWQVLPTLGDRLAHGGRAVIYVTNIVQVQSTVEVLPRTGLALERVVEILEREWVVDGEVVRPRQHMVGHTGFLVVARQRHRARRDDGSAG